MNLTKEGDRRTSLTEDLVILLDRPVTHEFRHRAALHVLDWAACAIAGRCSDVGRSLALHAETAVAGPVHALAVGGRSLEAALWLNGTLGSIHGMDDCHQALNLQPGAVVIPAALAVAEAAAATPRTLLDAIVRGYETAIRIAALLAPGPAGVWDLPILATRFGATAAGGAVIGLGDGAMVAAMGIAGGSAPLRQDAEGSLLSRPFVHAHAAVDGVRAALLAAHGLTGSRFVLDGPQGLIAAVAPNAEPAALTAKADDWRIAEVSLRRWGACHHAHAAMDAAVQLKGKLDPHKIRRVRIRTYSQALDACDIAHPHSLNEARFSLQHAVAVALAQAAPCLADFAPAGCADPDIAALREKIELAADDRFTSRFPVHCGARVEVEMDDGQTLTAEVDDPVGSPAQPLAIDALVTKARELIAWSGLMKEDEADRLIEAALYLPDAANLTSFLRALP